MPDILVKRAIEQARSRDPLVKAMALLHGSRVLAAMDKEIASQAFAEGVATAESLTLPDHQMETVLNEAVRLGAFADPIAAVALIRRLPAVHNRFPLFPRRLAGTALVQSLAQSGDFENALGLLEDLNCEVGGAQVVVQMASDPVLQRRAMAAARERWRAYRQHPDFDKGHLAEQDFFRLFSRHWRKLEAADQESWLDEILQALDTDANQAMHAGFGSVELHSTRDAHLFEILHVLRALKPADQVAAILRDHPDVANGAKVYPLGLESLMVERRPAPEGSPPGVAVCSSGSPSDDRWFAVIMAAHRGDPSAVQDLLAEAHRIYRRDADADDPNLAPLAFWPSCGAYRQTMYWAGDRSGQAAEPLLAEIPDADLALFASIELAAGTLGLPEPSGVSMIYHPGRPRRG